MYNSYFITARLSQTCHHEHFVSVPNSFVVSCLFELMNTYQVYVMLAFSYSSLCERASLAWTADLSVSRKKVFHFLKSSPVFLTALGGPMLGLGRKTASDLAVIREALAFVP